MLARLGLRITLATRVERLVVSGDGLLAKAQYVIHFAGGDGGAVKQGWIGIAGAADQIEGIGGLSEFALAAESDPQSPGSQFRLKGRILPCPSVFQRQAILGDGIGSVAGGMLLLL